MRTLTFISCIHCRRLVFPLSECFFFFTDTATAEIYTLSLHDALPIFAVGVMLRAAVLAAGRAELAEGEAVAAGLGQERSEEHTSELQSRPHLVCRLLLEKKKNTNPCRRSGDRLDSRQPRTQRRG